MDHRVVWVGVCMLFLSGLLAPPGAAAVGTTGASFLKLSVGARAEALGEAGVVGLDGVESLYWNPAALVAVESPQAMVSHQQLWQHVTATAIAFAFRNDRVGSIAVGLEQMGIGSWNNVSGEAGVDAGDLAVLVGIGRSLSERVAVGVAARTLHSNIGDHSASGFSVDCGLHYRVSDRLVLAGAVRNLGSGFSYMDAAADPLPSVGSFGGAFRWRSVLFVGEARKERGTDAYGAVGAEIRVHPLLSLRAGSRLGSTADRASSNAAWGLGVGLPAGLRFDYSFHDSDLGGSHQFSGTYLWGGGLGMEGGGAEYGSSASIPSNLVVIKGLLGAVVDSLMAVMPRPAGQRIVLKKSPDAITRAKEESGRTGDNLLESTLAERLTNMGFAVQLAGASRADTISAASASSSPAPVLEYRVMDLKVNYPSGGRRHFIGRKELQRMIWVDVQMRLMEGTDTVRWAGGGGRSHRDVVPLRMLNYLKTEGFGLTEAATEEQKWDRVLEPLIATAIIGGLIYLFYSNKGSD